MKVELYQSGGFKLIPMTKKEETKLAEFYKQNSHVHLCSKAFLLERPRKLRTLFLTPSVMRWKGRL